MNSSDDAALLRACCPIVEGIDPCGELVEVELDIGFTPVMRISRSFPVGVLLGSDTDETEIRLDLNRHEAVDRPYPISGRIQIQLAVVGRPGIRRGRALTQPQLLRG